MSARAKAPTFPKHWKWLAYAAPLWFVASAAGAIEYHNTFQGTAFETAAEEAVGLLACMSLGSVVVTGLLARKLSKSRGRIIETSRRDALTGLLNREAALKELRRLTSSAGNHALLMTDIDGLKRINDLYGHVSGDQALITVAGCLSEGDAVVGRYGGDEFVTILKNVSRHEAEDYRERVMSSLQTATVIDSVTGNRVDVHASLGIAMLPEDAREAEELLRLSDEAMYAVKRQRRATGEHSRQKYELNVERLASILGAFAPLLSGVKSLGDKMYDVAHRLRNATGSESIVVILKASQRAVTLARSAVPSADEGVELQVNSYFERPSYTESPIWQQLTRSGRPMVINDFQADGRIPDSGLEVASVAGMQSALLVPLNGPDGIIGALYVGSRHPQAFAPADVQFFKAVAQALLAVVNTSFLLEEIQEGAARLAEEQEATVMRLAAAAEAHDPATGPHQSRVREIAELISRELGLTPDDAHQIGLAAALHDVGKLYVPESLLASTGVLTAEEKRELQKHTYLGSQFLAGPGTELAAIVAQSHHEHWDGGGYPQGLRGDEIPEAACITAVADTLEAMTGERSYHRGRSLSYAIDEISTQSGKQFSPRVVKALLALSESGVLSDYFPVETKTVEQAA